PEQTAQAIYQDIYDFANYAFNKAHAVSYAVVAYQTAYCKRHYAKEYMAALLSSVLDYSDKVNEYFAECKENGIALLSPDVNHSFAGFTVEEGGIRFGLAAIKGVGRGLISRMAEEREKGGLFSNFRDFCRRMDGMDMNRRAIENLIRAGAFDSMGYKRSQLIQVYERVLSGIAQSNRSNLDGQMDFFGAASASPGREELELPDIPEYSPVERMAMEKETTGLYLSGHPMDAYRDVAKASGAVPIGKIRADFAAESGPSIFSDGQQVILAGVVSSSKTKTTKKNTLMTYATLEDDTGAIEMLCFARCIERYGSYLAEGQAIVAQGRLSVRDEKAPQLMCDFAQPLAEREKLFARSHPQIPTDGKTLYLRMPSMQSPEMEHFRRVIYMFEGQKNPVRIRLADTGKLIGTSCDLHNSLIQEMREKLGDENVVVK
ncbi:MAG: DNA polymerase III subunit alpha, partial [Lachnospiraceae bacterium]|nr:DNA polymerase III subunit alpha [Lachnospiraceae bacterium]